MRFPIMLLTGLMTGLLPLLGASAEAEPEPATEPNFRTETDHSGRHWSLEDWKQGDAEFPAPNETKDPKAYDDWLAKAGRPYPKDLKAREAWYRAKNGENWEGETFLGNAGHRIMTPGTWKWEVIATVPEPLASRMWINKDSYVLTNGRWLKKPGAQGTYRSKWCGDWPWPTLFAPGAGEVTDIYIMATFGLLHLDPKTQVFTEIGKVNEYNGQKDGTQTEASLSSGLSGTGGKGQPIADPITGRIYWQDIGNQEKRLGNTDPQRLTPRIRYAEKLLPYKSQPDNKVYLLPAILDYKEMYKQVKGPGGESLEPVMENGRRAVPTFMVRTLEFEGVKEANLLGQHPHPFVVPGGKIWLAAGRVGHGPMDTIFTYTKLFDIETGKALQTLECKASYPTNERVNDGVGSHGGACLGIDGRMYFCDHCGCSGGPMRLVDVNPRSGRLTTLYDSCWGVYAATRKEVLWDGPADAKTLTASSTLWQLQCPRTGAIINCGWDNSGIRRYLDGFVTSFIGGVEPYRTNWEGEDAPFSNYHNQMAIAPNGDLYVPLSQGFPQRVVRIYRTDWPKEQPAYGYGEKFLPREKIEAGMLEYARQYIADYDKQTAGQ